MHQLNDNRTPLADPHFSGGIVGSLTEIASHLTSLTRFLGDNHYIVTSSALRDYYRFLFPTAVERFAYIEGFSAFGVSFLTRLVPVRMIEQRSVYVNCDIVSTTAALVDIGERGYFLAGTVHNHPGLGAQATSPSGIDHAHHRRLERGKYRAIGLILTEDGFVRFYSGDMRFHVHVVGKDVTRIDKNLYRLTPQKEPNENEALEDIERED